MSVRLDARTSRLADEHAFLLSPSRKSLLCHAEVQLHTLAKGLFAPSCSHTESEEAVFEILPFVACVYS